MTPSDSPVARAARRVEAQLREAADDLAWHPPHESMDGAGADLLWSRVEDERRRTLRLRIDGHGITSVVASVEGQRVPVGHGGCVEQAVAGYRWLYGVGLLLVLLLTGCIRSRGQTEVRGYIGTDPVHLVAVSESETVPQPPADSDWLWQAVGIGAAALGLPGVGAAAVAMGGRRRPPPVPPPVPQPAPPAGGVA